MFMPLMKESIFVFFFSLILSGSPPSFNSSPKFSECFSFLSLLTTAIGFFGFEFFVIIFLFLLSLIVMLLQYSSDNYCCVYLYCGSNNVETLSCVRTDRSIPYSPWDIEGIFKKFRGLLV